MKLQIQQVRPNGHCLFQAVANQLSGDQVGLQY